MWLGHLIQPGVVVGCVREGCLEEVPSGLRLPVGSLRAKYTLSAGRMYGGGRWTGSHGSLGAIGQEGGEVLSAPVALISEVLPKGTLPLLAGSLPTPSNLALTRLLCCISFFF